MHLRPHAAQMDDPKVHDPLTSRFAPCHPRTSQPSAEHRLARRLRHSAADRHMVAAILRVIQVPDVIPQGTVRLPVRLGLADHDPTAWLFRSKAIGSWNLT